MLFATTACGTASGEDAGSTGEGDDDGFETPRLSFDEVALELPADRRRDINLRATGITTGRSFAVLDGAAIIQAGNVTAAGVLEEGLLELRLDGALAEGEHRLEVVTNGDGEILRSDPVTLLVTAPLAEGLPALERGDERGSVGPAVHIFGRPGADSTSLGLLRDDGNGGLELGIVVRGETRWLAGSPLVAALPGFSPADVDADDDPFTSAIDLVDFAPRTDPSQGLSYRTAWRADLTGGRVLFSVATATGDLPPTEGFDLASAVEGPVGAGRVEGVRWVGDTLAVAFVAFADAEQPQPGDRAVASVRVVEDRAQQRGLVANAGVSDVDQLHDVVSIADPDPARPRVGVRTHGGRARVLVGGAGAASVILRPDAAFDQSEDFPDPEDGPRWRGRVAFLGALDSLTVIGVRTDGHVRLVQGSAISGERTSIEIDDALPAVPPPGRPSGMVMRGLPIIAVPFGDAAPVQILVANGTQVSVAPLDDLRCDEVVLDASRRAADELVSDLACLANGEVTLHEVTLPPLP